MGTRSKPVHDLRWKVKDAPNLCPDCNKEPMVCPGCGRVNTPCCKLCDKWTVYNPKYPEYSDPLGFSLVHLEGDRIVDGKQWDGSDWFRIEGSPFVSNRAKEWMERTHTHPITFKPALLDIEGMDPALLKRLEQGGR